MSALKTKLEAANAALFGQQQLDQIPEYFAADYLVHIHGDETASGHGIIQKYVQSLLRAFPKLDYKIEILMEQKDRVAWQRTFHGTQDGPLQGFPASGKSVSWHDMVISRFQDGLIVEEWLVSDLAEQLLRSRKKGT